MKSLPLAVALAAVAGASVVSAGVSPQNFDPTVKPQDDFFRYVNGGWIKTTTIPPEFSRWGSFDELRDHTQTVLKEIVARAAAKGEKGNALERQVGDFFASGMDEAAIELAGIEPLRPELARIAALRTSADLLPAIARLHRLGIGAGFMFDSGPDDKDSSRELAQLWQGGLGLPERDYYFRPDEKSQKLRTEYVAHVARMLELLGDTPAVAQTGAATVMRLETALAQAARNRVALRDPVANYHKLAVADFAAQAGALDWPGYFAAVGAPKFAEVNVGQPEFFQALAKQLAETPVADWQVYLRWQLVHRAAPYLSAAFVQENFRFYGVTLTGVKEMRPRWKRVLDATDRSLGEALGQLYVAEQFPPEAKARVLKLVEDLRAAFRDRFQTLEWMDEPTRAKAQEKLAAFVVKMGYPDHWRDYSAVRIERGAFLANVLRAAEFDVQRSLKKIGQPVDKTEWHMSPQTVNAYYNPSANEIVFPAAILQPPFFDAKADDAVNYGGIGAVIGHEMTHGFDDQGRQYDAQGNLVDWWTPECAARFKARTAGIVQQYGEYTVLDGLHLTGELTQGENIADFGGVKLGYAALQKALAGQPRPLIDGFTPEQRFFLSYASIWRIVFRPETLRLQVNTDPHSPGEFRVRGPLSNFDEFFTAFAVPEGAPMRRPVAEQVKVW